MRSRDVFGHIPFDSFVDVEEIYKSEKNNTRSSCL